MADARVGHRCDGLGAGSDQAETHRVALVDGDVAAVRAVEDQAVGPDTAGAAERAGESDVLGDLGVGLTVRAGVGHAADDRAAARRMTECHAAPLA